MSNRIDMPKSRLKLLLPYLLPATAFTAIAAAMWPDIGPNLFSDIIALWFGLFVIDKLLARHQLDSEAPARLAAWRNVWRLHSEIILFVDLCVEHHWTVPSAQKLWQAHIEQRGHPLSELLSSLVIDSDNSTTTGTLGTGRFAADTHFKKAVREADRFSNRYITVSSPSIIEIIERFDSLILTEGLTSWGPHISHIGPTVWDQLFDIEAELRQALATASTEYGDASLPRARPLLADIERWLRTNSGWSDKARIAVERPLEQR